MTDWSQQAQVRVYELRKYDSSSPNKSYLTQICILLNKMLKAQSYIKKIQRGQNVIRYSNSF